MYKIMLHSPTVYYYQTVIGNGRVVLTPNRNRAAKFSSYDRAHIIAHNLRKELHLSYGELIVCHD